MSVLDTIVAAKRAEVARRRIRLPPATLRALVEEAPQPRDFARALRSGPAPRIIAEVKRASPSRGVLKPAQRPAEWDPVALARAYARGGAACLSVLTDGRFFWGSDDHLVACREAVALPVLRKEFIVDAYQIDESRWLGADCVLLMASVLDDGQLATFAERAITLGMSVLFESHTAGDLARVNALGVPRQYALCGINHRDLHTLELDMQRALQLREQIPASWTVVAESGLRIAADLWPLMAADIEAFLVGGELASHDEPAAAVAALRGL